MNNTNKEIFQQYRLSLTGIACASCVVAIERALKAVPGVRVAHVVVLVS